MGRPDNKYDEVPYPSAIYSQTHPDRLATVATLYGLGPPPVSRCRVLELGCGDGTNLISMASALPEARFTGIDLAGEPIRRGCDLVKKLGLQNVDLRAENILQADLGKTPFDYIVAHGLYSWVPAAVRDRILEICRERLASHGVAFISYNAYPGNHLRDCARGMMQYHARNFRDPNQQIRQARGLLKLVSQARSEPDVFQKVIAQEFERCAKYADAGFFHDDLSAANQPVYFWQFIEHARAFELQFAAEADLWDMEPDGLSPDVVKVLGELDPANVIAREQYLDFFKGRAFRQTLLCRAGIKINPRADSECVANLVASADVKSLGVNANGSEDFSGPNGAVISTADPHAREALRRLGDIWPRCAAARELVDAQMTPASPAAFYAFLLRCYQIGFIQLHTWSPLFATEVSDRPRASALSRCIAGISNIVPTPRHTTLQVDSLLARKLIQLLDGEHTHASLIREISADEPSFDDEALQTLLRFLARAGLLVA